MYFFKSKGKQVLDLRGDLVLTHNDAIVKSRVKSSAPAGVQNAKYILNISRFGAWHKFRASYHALRFIWGKDQALTADTIEGEGI